jgi:hypothetical protein
LRIALVSFFDSRFAVLKVSRMQQLRFALVGNFSYYEFFWKSGFVFPAEWSIAGNEFV